jgi:hypothetical protein
MIHFAFLSTDHGADRWILSSDFKLKSERFDLTALGLADFVILALSSASTSVPAHTIAWIFDSSADQTTVYVNSTDHSLHIGDTSLTEVHLHGMVTIEPSELAFAPEPMALAVAAQPTDRGIATAYDHGTAVMTVSADISSDATPSAHDKRTSQASDQSHTLDAVRDRMELSDHSGSIRDDEGGRHLTETTHDDAATAPANVESSAKPQHALQTETVAAPNPPPDLDKADAPANGSGIAPTPSYLIHTANTAVPDVPEVNAPDTPDMKTDLHSDKHGLMLGHEWAQSSRGDWQFNFSWKSDGSAHAADAGMANMNASMHGGDAFHFDLSSMTHETSAAGDTFGHHSNEENSDAARPPADHFHAAHHASHDFMV